MAAGYKAGDKAYIVESNRIVRECTVVRPAGNLVFTSFLFFLYSIFHRLLLWNSRVQYQHRMMPRQDRHG